MTEEKYHGSGGLVVGKTIPEVCILAIYLEESARLQTEAMKLGEPKFLSAEEAERVARRTFKSPSNARAWEHFQAKIATR